MKKVIIIGALIAVGAGVWFLRTDWGFRADALKPQYVLTRIEKRDMVTSVSATGTLSAVVTVEVGSQVSGQLKELWVDFNSQVTRNQVIARINPDSYETLVRQAEAELEMANASLATDKLQILRYEADLANMEANWEAAVAQTKKARVIAENAKLNMEHQKLLVQKQVVAKNDFDQAKASYEEALAFLEQSVAQEAAAQSKIRSSRASLSVAQAGIREAEAQVMLKKAALDKKKVDLENTIIRSPVDGVVIDRNVNIGQTVAASLTAPVLFTIAQDLRSMQVSASVDEADIGQIQVGQSAPFTVDAFGNKTFNGEVMQIRKLGKTIQNVVTYEVIISAENHDLRLMPGMTADVEIVLMNKPQVLAVANAALRFSPPGGQAPEPKTPNFHTGLDRKARGGNAFARPLTGERRDPQSRLSHYTEQLGLTESQQEELKVFFDEMMQKARSSRESNTAIGPARGGVGSIREKMRKETQAVMARILTPEQQKRLDEMEQVSQPKTGTLWYQNEQGELQSLQVKLGVSDTTHTELFGEMVKPGMQFITKTRAQ